MKEAALHRPLPILAASLSVALAAGALAGTLTGCEPPKLFNGTQGQATPGPVDGYYLVQAWTCGGTDLYAYQRSRLPFQKLVLGFANQGASYLVVYPSQCGNNLAFAAQYDPAASTVTLTDESQSCDIDCNPTECVPQAAPTPAHATTWQYSLMGGVNLTLTRTLASDDLQPGSLYVEAGCSAGQVETRTATLQ